LPNSYEFDISPKARSSIVKIRINSIVFFGFGDTVEVNISHLDESGHVAKFDCLTWSNLPTSPVNSPPDQLSAFTDFMNGLKLDTDFLKTAILNKLEAV